MNYKQFLTKKINEVYGKKTRAFGDPKDSLIHDREFLKQVVDNGGAWVDFESKVYFEKPSQESEFLTPDKISKRFAGGGGIKLRKDMVTGKEFMSAGSAHRRNKTYHDHKMGFKKFAKDEKFVEPEKEFDPKDISPLNDFVLDADELKDDDTISPKEILSFEPNMAMAEGKKATVKTKTAPMEAFTQYQVWNNGVLVKSFYDKKEAVNLRDKINS